MQTLPRLAQAACALGALTLAGSALAVPAPTHWAYDHVRKIQDNPKLANCLHYVRTIGIPSPRGSTTRTEDYGYKWAHKSVACGGAKETFRAEVVITALGTSDPMAICQKKAAEHLRNRVQYGNKADGALILEGWMAEAMPTLKQLSSGFSLRYKCTNLVIYTVNRPMPNT